MNGHVQYVTVDAIGLPRFADDAGMVDRGVGGAPVVDMGAYEFPGTSCPADITGDGTVDVSDMLALLGKWGLCDLCDADINVDGIVDVTDMLMLLGAWGDCP